MALYLYWVKPELSNYLVGGLCIAVLNMKNDIKLTLIINSKKF